MVRTNPHHDWDEPRGTVRHSARKSVDGEWESLRNEIVALLDHVEDQVAGARLEQRPPAPRPVDTGRRHEALKSVRQAVDRLADRSEPEPVARRETSSRVARDSVTDAINQIRARQGAATASPVPSQSVELAGFAQAVASLGARIEAFEARIASRIDGLPGTSDIAAQVGQLSEVIEMLAGAVANNSDVKRLGQLTETVERLAAHQVENSGRSQQFQDRQDQGLHAIEETVRNIYERIDALEAARGAPSPEIERIGRDVGAISSAIAGSENDAVEIIARIDALQERIAAIPGTGNGPTELGFSIDALRDAIVAALEPRFEALEGRHDASGIEAQLRQISQTVENTSTQLQALAALRDAAPAMQAEPDFDALADLIVKRTRETMRGEEPAGATIEKSDLDALETRLANLFSADTSSDRPDPGLSIVKDSIAQVDNRIGRLEAMLNGRTVAAQPTSEQAASMPRRREPVDAMPNDPVSGSPRKVLSEEPAVTLETARPQAPSGFRIDPESVDRPAKPQSSFAADPDKPFAPERTPAPEHRELPGSRSTVSRSNFIEAARRSARQQPDDTPESKSLIARALSRFQKSEDAQEQVSAPAPAFSEERIAPQVEAAEDPFVGAATPDEAEAPRPGFLARNRRALLLGAALVLVVALAVPLVVNRIIGAPSPSRTEPSPAPAAVTEPAPAPEETAAPVPDAPSGDVSDLMNGVRMIDTAAPLSPATLNADVMSGNGAIDPIQTATLQNPPDRYIDRSVAPATNSARMPEISVPAEIEPALLRDAAESGDSRAQFEVGAILTEGHVIEQDLAQAAAWYERSAAQGFAPAQYRLGNLFESGRGVERDIELARLWYQRAAESGNRMSMHNLASLYAGGELETQDFEAAAHWFEEAGARGLTDSQFNLGMLYARGLGVEQSFENSYFWFSLAAQSGDEDAVAAREDVARSLDTDAIQQLNEQIAQWAPAEIDMAANFAPIGTWDAEFDPGQAIANTEVIQRVQMLLSKLGYDIGQPDGIAGPRTREAILAFERATGMTEKGDINPRLLAVLGSQPV